MVVSLNYCSQNGGNLYRAPYYNGNPNIGPRIIGNLDQYPYNMARVGRWSFFSSWNRLDYFHQLVPSLNHPL